MESAQALALFVFFSVITPGPNNLMIMNSAMNFGVARSMPHFMGIALGYPLMLVAMGLGLSQVFEQFPGVIQALQVVCGFMIVWLAWKMTRQVSNNTQQNPEAKPITLLQAAAFQWVNPKAWFMCTATIALFPPSQDDRYFDLLLLTLVATGVGAVCVSIWMLSGVPLRKLMNRPLLLRNFNYAMAISLLGFYAFSVLV